MKSEEFVTLVRELFAFLEREYALSFSWGHDYVVRFDSARVFVLVLYDATRSYDLWVQIGLQAGIEHDVERPFWISEILQAAGQGQLREAHYMIQSPATDLRKYLERFAEFIRQYASGLLAGDIELFRILDRQRDADCEAYALKSTLFHARQDAAKAWEWGRYDEVVAELEKIVDHLSPAEQKKLAIARKRIKPN